MKARTNASRFMLLILGAVALLSVYAVQAQDAASNEADRAAVLEANERFYVALNAMFAGDPAPFEDVWWHTDDIVYMGADGAYNVGWEQTYANWQEQAAQNIGGHASAEDVHVTIGGDIAMTNQYTVGVNEFDDGPQEIRLRATSVFSRQDGQWRMICHHVDVIPTLGAEMQNP